MSDKTMHEFNRKANLTFAKDWLQRINCQMFVIREDGHKHSLKAFLSSDEKILWMEFKTTGKKPSFSCPISLFEDPSDFRKASDVEWTKLRGIANSVIEPEFGNA